MVVCSHGLDECSESGMVVEACQGRPQAASLKVGGRHGTGGGSGGKDVLSIRVHLQRPGTTIAAWIKTLLK